MCIRDRSEALLACLQTAAHRDARVLTIRAIEHGATACPIVAVAPGRDDKHRGANAEDSCFHELYTPFRSTLRAKGSASFGASGDHFHPAEHPIVEVDVHGADDEIGPSRAEADHLDSILR